MSTTITTRLERRVEADPSGMTVTDTTDGQSIMVALTRAQAGELAAALDPERDLSGVDWRAMHVRACSDLDELRSLIEGQKEHVSKSIEVRNRMRRERDEALRKKGEAFDRAVRAERERDAAVARTEAAEKRHTWPKTTPTGHTYTAPDTYAALCHQHGNAAQAAIESWEADECPPEPTWEMVGIAHREVERIQRERDECKARAEQAENARDTVATRAGQLEKRLAKVMSDYQDLEDEREEIADQFATFRAEIVAEAVTARKSAVPRTDIEEQLRIAYESGNHPIERIRIATDAMCDLFSVEAEQATDPVEEKARELYRAATPDARWETVADEYRRIAAHVLGQEVGSYA